MDRCREPIQKLDREPKIGLEGLAEPSTILCITTLTFTRIKHVAGLLTEPKIGLEGLVNPYSLPTRREDDGFVAKTIALGPTARLCD